MLLNDPVEIGLPTSLHLLVLLVVLAIVLASGSRSPPRAALALAWAAAAWALLCLTPAVADRLVVSLEGDPMATAALRIDSDPSTRIVVLASGNLVGPSGRTRIRLTRDGWERIHAGVELWRRTGGALVFTGGPDADPEGSIAAYGARLARELGVPAASVLVSPKGENTLGELAGAARLLDGHEGPRWLVTSALHMRRSHATALRLGMAIQPYPVGHIQIRDHGWWTWVPSNAAIERLRLALHEYAGMLVYAWRDGRGSR